ncbi:MAG: WD40 repeat domain-containing protein [Anaerolineae bacterium]|nr:WD40 repeat domain-containing protein [Anaerolineae bacterium]
MDFDKVRRRLRSRWPWFGPRQRHQAVLDLIEDGSPQAIGMLARESSKPDSKSGEIYVLLQKLSTKSAVAREALCQMVIQHDHPGARRLVLALHYYPQDPQLRALFYFLTEQWEPYETLDFDGRMLRAAYAAVAPSIRERVATLARRVGRVAWVEAAAGGQQGRRLAEMSDVEWKSALLLLFQSRRYDELWRLAQTAPLLWSARSLDLLRRAKWPPPDSPHRDVLTEIVNLAARCEGEPPAWGDAVDEQARLVAHSGKALALVLGPDDQTLFSGGSDGVVHLWELPSGQKLGTFKGEGGPITALALTLDGQFLVAGDMAGRLYLWDVADQKQVSGAEAHQSALTVLRVAPDQRMLLSGGHDGAVHAWSLPDLDHIAQYKTGNDAPVAKLALAPDGEWLACSKTRATVVGVWRLPGGEDSRFLSGSFDAGLAFSHGGTLLASGNALLVRDQTTNTTVTTDAHIALWRVGSWSLDGVLRRHREPILSLLWTPDDRTLISGGRDNCLHLWSMPSRKHRRELPRHTSDVGRLVLDPSGQFLLSGGLHQSARLWNLSRGELLKALQGYSNVISDFVLAPKTRILATSDWDGKVALWRLGPALLRALPLNQIELRDIDWIEAMLQHKSMTQTGEAWLRFALALLHWRHRFDIEIEDAPRHIEVGEFDIEIEG